MTNKPDNPTKQSFAVRANIWLLRFTRNWLKVALVIIGLYAFLPFAAPTLMKLGATGAANVLYTMYSPMCHQFAFRSIFLYGEQPFYPRSITDSGLRSYEEYVADIPDFYDEFQETIPGFRIPTDPQGFSRSFWEPARFFTGNEQMGYKTTLCARDAAIYVMIFVGGLIYLIPYVRRRLRPLPIWIYVIVGLGPIGLDGFSQLLSYDPWNFWPVRETEPFFRVATGAIFGLMNAWLGLPYIEASMQETRREIEHKLSRAGIVID